jgi:hypothetical protein
MKRSVRNGIAIAGMAGGFFLLGQAVAGADEGVNNASAGDGAEYSADATNTNSSETTGGAGGGDGDGGEAETEVEQNSSATNNVENEAETGDITATGGSSYVIVLAGNGNELEAESEEGDVNASQSVHNEVNVESHAGDASVSGSNNASAGNGASYTANSSNSNTSETTGGDGGDDGDGGEAETEVDQDSTARNNVDNDAETGDIYAHGGNSGVFVVAGNGNEAEAEGEEGDVDAEQDITNEVDVWSRAGDAHVEDSNNASSGDDAEYHAYSANENEARTEGGEGGEDGDGGDADTDVDQDSSARNNVENEAETGDIVAVGGDSIIKVIVGNGNTLKCESEEGDVDCSQHITNIINILSVAGGANVTCSNNASAGGSGWVCKVEDDKPAGEKPAGEKPAGEKPAGEDEEEADVKPAKYHAAPVNKTAQPKGELAYTGAETTAPLTLGLLALGAGGALTLAGRRRQTTSV